MKQRGLILLLAVAMLGTAPVLPVRAAVISDAQTAEQEKEQDRAQTQTALAASGIAADAKKTMYIADRNYQVLRMRAKNGTYTVLAGETGISGYRDGSAKQALFQAPWDTAAYKGGWLISDSENHALRLYKNGRVTTVAGNGKPGYKDASGSRARLNRPTGMAAGRHGEVYIADTGNNVIRKIDKKGNVTTYAGGAAGCADGSLKKARFYEPTGVYYYKGALYVADSGNHRVCRIADGQVTTVAGSKKGIEGDADGNARKARLSNPQDIYVNADAVYISDTGNACVKKLAGGRVTTVIKSFSMDDGRAPAEPCGLTVIGKKLFIGDMFTEELYSVQL